MDEQQWRINTSATEYVWRPSRSLGARAQVLGGMNVHGYDPPTLASLGGISPFAWDVKADTAQQPAPFGPLQDNPDLDDVNVEAFVAVTAAIAAEHAGHILPSSDGTVNLAWQFGTDFNYMQVRRRQVPKPTSN